MLELNLCKNCAEDLKSYNPYVDKEGNTIPLDQIKINIVPTEQCRNYEVNGEFVNMSK